tara:strand:+ start:148 stop:903 length:756 start_codon:yes stop_codon:yes gene_type:complete
MKHIKFSCHPDLVEEKEIHPIPATKSVPEWYKKIPKFQNQMSRDLTIKSCVPVLDSITAGYLLRMPQDMELQHNVWIEEQKKYVTYIGFAQRDSMGLEHVNYNVQLDAEEHPNIQVGGPDGFYSKKHRGMGIPKILNPFKIQTSPGYSCLFIPPMHREEDYFHIMPGIVDTDNFPMTVNFPFILNTDKYKKINTVVKIGTPYVQVIPFKRDSWQMSVGVTEPNEMKKKSFLHKLRMFDIYKSKWWNKKSYK